MSTLRFALLLGAILSFVSAARAASISVNMTDGGPGAGSASAANTAGAVLLGYWNTISTDGSGLSGTNTASLLNDVGANSGVSVVQSSAQGGTFHTSSAYSGTIGNKVMENFTDTGGSYNYTFSNVTAGVGNLYDVYIYSARNFSNTGVAQFDVNGQTLFLANEDPNGDYTESGFPTQALAEANLNAGDYVRFRNVGLDTLVVGVTGLVDTTNGGSLAPVNAIQLIQVPEPAGMTLWIAAGLVFLSRHHVNRVHDRSASQP